jgi:RNA polymerase sigma-70 factor (ECF subfamily)
LYSWLYRITTNTALEKLRKKHPEQFLLDVDTVDYGSHGSSSLVELPHYDKKDIMAVDFQAELNSLLNELNAKLRIVFILRDIEGNSVSETAQILNLSESNVKVRLMRARMFLKEKLSVNYLERV